MNAPRVLRRVFGSVRVRVALVAGLAFAVTLIAGSVLLLHTLETKLVSDIRSADEAELRTQGMRFLTTGLPSPELAPGLQPIAGDRTITFQMFSDDGRQAIAVTAIGLGPGTDTADLLAGSGAGATVGSDPPTTAGLDDAPTPSGPGAAVPGSTIAGAHGSADPAMGVTVSNAAFFDNLVISGAAGSSQAASVPIDGQSAKLLGVAGEAGPFLTSTYKVTPGLALTTASSLAEVDRTLSATRTILWWAVPLLVLLVMGAAWLFVGRALRPVHALTAQAATITAESLHERVPVSPVGDEVSELATTINSMLARIETSDRTSKRLVSDASHELRTPIAVMRTELEVARRNPDARWDEVSDTVLGEVDRLQSLVDDLLLLARLGERGTATEPFSLLDTVRDVAGRRHCTEVDVTDTPETVVVGDSMAVQRALDHVAANAARHAAARVTVSVDAERPDGLIAIHVDDDGPGIPVADRERVLQRFERLDEARSRDAGGSGLGLAVASDVMAAHGGRVDIADSALGGARVTLLLNPAGVT